MSVIERIEESAAGLVKRRIKIAPDGQRIAFDEYREAGLHIWRRDISETPEAFEKRLLDEAALLALRRERVVHLEPVGAGW